MTPRRIATRAFALSAVIGCVLAPGAGAGCGASTGSARRSASPPSAAARATRTVLVWPLGRDLPSRPQVRVVRAQAAPAAPTVEAAPALERARTAYRDLAFEEALSATGEAQLLLEARAHSEADFDALGQALLYRGMAELALGRADRAREALRTVVILRPALSLDESRFAPEVRALHQEMVAAVRADPPSAITITAEPADAHVSVDGRSLGRAPRTVQGSPGRHYVEVAALGHETRVLSVVLEPGGSPALHVALPLASPEVVASSLAAMDRAPVALRREERTSLRAALGADRLVLPAPCEAACARVIDLRDGATSDVSGASWRLLLDRLDASRSTAGPRVDADRERGGSWLASPWPWVVLGAVAVGAAGITAGLVVTDDPGTRVVLRPQ